MGPALGITAWLGVVFAAVYAFRKRQGVWLVPLAWVLGYFGFMGAQFSLYMRYFLPLYPTLTVFAAFAAVPDWRVGVVGDRSGLASLGALGDASALRPAVAHRRRAARSPSSS